MYQPDLAPYRNDRTTDRVLAVGWLDREHAFPTAPPTPNLEQGIRRVLSKGPVNLMRGIHGCPFCQQDMILIPGTRRHLGSAEIWVPGPDGSVFAAPDLIYHYVTEHSYLPPTSFISAVETLTVDTWNPNATFEEHFVAWER